MKGVSPTSTIVCQKDIWKTCVVCGELNKKISMRCLSNASQLHVIVAYLKFSEGLDEKKDFSSYDDKKAYECFVCSSHVDVPVRALRNIYAFPPQVPVVNGKCDPQGLLRVLKKFMPPRYSNMSIDELSALLPGSKAPETKEVRKADCTCCSILDDTRRRLNKVIENAEYTATSVRLNFAVYEELVDVAKHLDYEMQTDFVVKDKPAVDSESARLAQENILLKFEQRRQQMEYPEPVTLGPFPERPERPERPDRPDFNLNLQSIARRPIGILPSHPGVQRPVTALEVILNPLTAQWDDGDTPKQSTQICVNRIAEPARFPVKRVDKRKLPLASIAQLSNKQGLGSSRKPMISPRAQNQNFSLPYSQQSRLLEEVHEGAKLLLNSKLIVFSTDDVRQLLVGRGRLLISETLLQLESRGLIHSHPFCSPTHDYPFFIYLKEFRKHQLNELWSYSIIPEHYRQRLIGSSASETVREQFEKHKSVLLEMDKDPQLVGLIGMILSASANSDLEFEFSKFKSKTLKETVTIKTRTPKLKLPESDPSIEEIL
ncbi:unnamed protein product [Caenorhabditis sp. 36 PRJEB53466]|nr:unnamed protein product [Caenorhabditis sp. 36 PRJEB53466]